MRYSFLTIVCLVTVTGLCTGGLAADGVMHGNTVFSRPHYYNLATPMNTNPTPTPTPEPDPTSGPDDLPDLKMVSGHIRFDPDNPDPESWFTISAKIMNIGHAPAYEVRVTFRDCETQAILGVRVLPYVSPDDAEWTEIPAKFDVAGFRLIEVEIDEYNTIQERKEDNNIANKLLRIGYPGAGDAVIQVSVNHVHSYPGGEVEAQGLARYQLTDGDDDPDYWTYPVMGGTVTVEITENGEIWGGAYTNTFGSFAQPLTAPLEIGTYRIVATVTDYTLTGDAWASMFVYPGGSPPPPSWWELGVYSEDIVFEIDEPDAGVPIEICANIHNFGNSQADDVVVRFYDFDDVLGEDVVTIPSGGNAVACFAGYSYPESEWRLIRVVVDPDNLIPECHDWRNNEADRALPVGDPGDENALLRIMMPTASGYECDYAWVKGYVFYEFWLNRGFEIAPQRGGLVERVYLQETGAEWFGGSHCDYWTNFSRSFETPCEPGNFHLTVTHTDQTLRFDTDTDLVVLPEPTPEEGIPDLWVHSEDILFSNNEPDAGEDVTIYAYVHYVNPDDPEEPFLNPVTATFYNIYYDGEPHEEVIGSCSFNFPEGPAIEMCEVGWEAHSVRTHIIKVELRYYPPDFGWLYNDAATRALVVGDPPDPLNVNLLTYGVEPYASSCEKPVHIEIEIYGEGGVPVTPTDMSTGSFEFVQNGHIVDDVLSLKDGPYHAGNGRYIIDWDPPDDLFGMIELKALAIDQQGIEGRSSRTIEVTLGDIDGPIITAVYGAEPDGAYFVNPVITAEAIDNCTPYVEVEVEQGFVEGSDCQYYAILTSVDDFGNVTEDSFVYYVDPNDCDNDLLPDCVDPFWNFGCEEGNKVRLEEHDAVMHLMIDKFSFGLSACDGLPPTPEILVQLVIGDTILFSTPLNNFTIIGQGRFRFRQEPDIDVVLNLNKGVVTFDLDSLDPALFNLGNGLQIEVLVGNHGSARMLPLTSWDNHYDFTAHPQVHCQADEFSCPTCSYLYSLTCHYSGDLNVDQVEVRSYSGSLIDTVPIDQNGIFVAPIIDHDLFTRFVFVDPPHEEGFSVFTNCSNLPDELVAPGSRFDAPNGIEILEWMIEPPVEICEDN